MHKVLIFKNMVSTHHWYLLYSILSLDFLCGVAALQKLI